MSESTNWEQEYIQILSEGVEKAMAADLAERDALEKRIADNKADLANTEGLISLEAKARAEVIEAYGGKNLEKHAERLSLVDKKVELLRARVERLTAEGATLDSELAEVRRRISTKGRSTLRQIHHDEDTKIHEVTAKLAGRYEGWYKALQHVERAHRLRIDPYPTTILHLTLDESLKKYA